MLVAVELKGKRILVVGVARTGLATSLFCRKHGAKVTTIDKRSELELAGTVQELRAAGVTVIVGETPNEETFEQDLVIPSPGVPASGALLEAIRRRGIPIWSEIELADRFLN